MQTKSRLSVFALFSMLLALSGCMKSGEDATGLKSEPSQGLDAGHGGARLVLPAIDPSALAKAGLDTSLTDTLAAAWLELRISGESMKEMFYRFPLTIQGGQSIEIKGIPAGKGRKFHGSLFTPNRVLTHAGITVADIQGGMYADVRLYLAKASGSAGICVVIEGQKLPGCAVADTLPPPTDPLPVPVPPKPDSGAIGSIPLPGSDTVLTTLCFEMRFDYGSNPRCETPGHAKMSFLDGAITNGNILLAEWPGLHFWSIRGQYDSSVIRFYGVSEADSAGSRDTLSLQGYLGAGATMAKGDYVRLPSDKKGNWTMNLVTCGAWTPVYPDSSCYGAGK